MTEDKHALERRDKQIVELQREVQYLRLLSMKYGNQNELMLSALERIAEQITTGVFFDAAAYARETIAQVKTITASK